MPITAITIENFKGIRDLVCVNLKPISLLFGPQQFRQKCAPRNGREAGVPVVSFGDFGVIRYNSKEIEI